MSSSPLLGIVLEKVQQPRFEIGMNQNHDWSQQQVTFTLAVTFADEREASVILGAFTKR